MLGQQCSKRRPYISQCPDGVNPPGLCRDAACCVRRPDGKIIRMAQIFQDDRGLARCGRSKRRPYHRYHLRTIFPTKFQLSSSEIICILFFVHYLLKQLHFQKENGFKNRNVLCMLKLTFCQICIYICTEN